MADKNGQLVRAIPLGRVLAEKSFFQADAGRLIWLEGFDTFPYGPL